MTSVLREDKQRVDLGKPRPAVPGKRQALRGSMRGRVVVVAAAVRVDVARGVPVVWYRGGDKTSAALAHVTPDENVPGKVTRRDDRARVVRRAAQNVVA